MFRFKQLAIYMINGDNVGVCGSCGSCAAAVEQILSRYPTYILDTTLGSEA